MEKNRSASYSNKGYQGEPSDQRIPSREYNYQGQPYGQRIPSMQNSYKGEPSDQRIPSREYNEQGAPSNQRIPSREYNYQGQPYGQRIPSREYNEQGAPSYQHIPSRQNFGFDGVSQLTSNQQATPEQYLGQSPYPLGPGRYDGPQVHYVPGQQVYIVPTHDQAIPQPGVQYMVRDTTTPMPVDNEVSRPIECIITFRVISALFILLDICLNWIQIASWTGNTGVPGWLDFLETVNSLKGYSPKAKCIQGSQSLTSTYALFCAIGTAYGLVRIVNMVGETIIEYNKQRRSGNEPRFRGFQILHGWVETVLGLVCDDIPQGILLIFFSVYCELDIIVAGKVFGWMIFKSLKNLIRFGSCKQHYKPCQCETKGCCEDCCVYSFDFLCCCTIFYFRPCACSGDKQCCEIKSYDICPDLSCSRGEKCCGEFEQDPEWAMNLFLKLSELFYLLYMAVIIVTIVKHFT